MFFTELDIDNRCENPFYFGKCNTCKGANSGGTRRKTTTSQCKIS